jgi:NitT/TauT family transport system substrate-binding protein
MSIARRIVASIAALGISAGVVTAARAEPLRVGYITWIGEGPLFVAREKGFFAKEGVDVELIDMSVHEAMFAGLFADQVDVISVTVDDMLPNFDPADPYVCVLAIDDDYGASGLLATDDIRSIADLRGRTVAFPKRTVSEFHLNVLLREAGLSEADIEPVEMSADDAGNAFLMREVDAAVTWEPFLTQVRQFGRGHVLADSAQTPGLIVDCLVAKAKVFDERLPEFRALARAWDEAVHYAEAHPDEANQIMARHVGGGNDDPAAFAESLKGVRFYDAARNREYFGSPESPGQIYRTSQYAIDIWSSLGALHTKLTPADVIRHDLWIE